MTMMFYHPWELNCLLRYEAGPVQGVNSEPAPAEALAGSVGSTVLSLSKWGDWNAEPG